jgi:quercetin dioxygenase-like cupin family protein
MTIALTQPGHGETFAAAGATFRVLDDGTPSSGRFGVVEVTMAPGWGGPPEHVHREHDETFFVLTGTVRFTSGADSHLAPAGALVTAPIGVRHAFGNPDIDQPASVLCTVVPELYIGYFRELAALRPGPDGRLDPAEVFAIMSAYATDPAPPLVS